MGDREGERRQAPLPVGAVYCVSPGVVARSIAGRLVVVPVSADAGRPEDELYALNDTGEAVLTRIDGTRSLRQVIEELVWEYHADQGVVERDVMALVVDLLQRRILIESGS